MCSVDERAHGAVGTGGKESVVGLIVTTSEDEEVRRRRESVEATTTNGRKETEKRPKSSGKETGRGARGGAGTK
jgi:hypothetical protein